MGAFQDLRYKVFGRLTVLYRNGSKNKRALWKCQCSCGKELDVSANNLKTGKTKSCGCLRVETSENSIKNIIGYGTLEKGQAVLNQIFKDYKYAAKQKNLSFSISKQHFTRLTKQNCLYCNKEPKHEFKKRNLNGSYVGNGVDRINSDLGYVDGNVVPCCKVCNIMKNVLTVEEFIEHTRNIQNNVSRIKEFLCLK